MPYVVIKLTDRNTLYCSDRKFSSPAEGEAWVRACLVHFNIPHGEIHSAYRAHSQPKNAIIWSAEDDKTMVAPGGQSAPKPGTDPGRSA
jgi:hypothetical protein